MNTAVTRIVVIGNGATALDSGESAHVNRHTADLLEGLARAGFHVTFVQPRETLRRSGNLQDTSLAPGLVRSVVIDTRTWWVIFLSTCLMVWSIFRADFVYLFFPGKLPRYVGHMCRIMRKPYALYLRGQRFHTSGGDARLFSTAQFITSVSESLSIELNSVNRRIFLIRPMLDLGAQDERSRDFSKVGLLAPVHLLFVGRLESAKGVPELVEAAEMLRRKGIRFRLSLVGGGVLFDELAIRYESMSEHVALVGPIGDRATLMEIYESADIFILPTHHEGFPRVLYEAMIKSIPIVTTMVGGIPGLMIDGENCIEVPVNNPQAIVDAVMQLSGDRQLMQSIAESGFDTVRAVLAGRTPHLDILTRELYAFSNC